jgi:hypothetical protein
MLCPFIFAKIINQLSTLMYYFTQYVCKLTKEHPTSENMNTRCIKSRHASLKKHISCYSRVVLLRSSRSIFCCFREFVYTYIHLIRCQLRCFMNSLRTSFWCTIILSRLQTIILSVHIDAILANYLSCYTCKRQDFSATYI